jgi:hypothetical protein
MMRVHQVIDRLARWWWAALLVARVVALALGVWGYRRWNPTTSTCVGLRSRAARSCARDCR